MYKVKELSPHWETEGRHTFPPSCPLGTGTQEEHKHLWRKDSESWWSEHQEHPTSCTREYRNVLIAPPPPGSATYSCEETRVTDAPQRI